MTQTALHGRPLRAAAFFPGFIQAAASMAPFGANKASLTVGRAEHKQHKRDMSSTENCKRLRQASRIVKHERQVMPCELTFRLNKQRLHACAASVANSRRGRSERRIAEPLPHNGRSVRNQIIDQVMARNGFAGPTSWTVMPDGHTEGKRLKRFMPNHLTMPLTKRLETAVCQNARLIKQAMKTCLFGRFLTIPLASPLVSRLDAGVPFQP